MDLKEAQDRLCLAAEKDIENHGLCESVTKQLNDATQSNQENKSLVDQLNKEVSCWKPGN